MQSVQSLINKRMKYELKNNRTIPFHSLYQVQMLLHLEVRF